MLDNRDKIIKDGNDIMSKENLLLFNAYRRRLKKRKLEFDTIYAYERDIKMWFTFLHTRQNNLMAYEVTAEDLEEYFELKPIKITNSQTKVRDAGFEIVSLK